MAGPVYRSANLEDGVAISAEVRLRLLAAIDRIMPRDADPGALDLGTDNYVLAQLAGDAAEHRGEGPGA